MCLPPPPPRPPHRRHALALQERDTGPTSARGCVDVPTLELCDALLRGVAHELSLFEATRPVAFLGIPATSAMFTSIAAVLLSTVVAAVSKYVPQLVEALRAKAGAG